MVGGLTVARRLLQCHVWPPCVLMHAGASICTYNTDTCANEPMPLFCVPGTALHRSGKLCAVASRAPRSLYPRLYTFGLYAGELHNEFNERDQSIVVVQVEYTSCV